MINPPSKRTFCINRKARRLPAGFNLMMKSLICSEIFAHPRSQQPLGLLFTGQESAKRDHKPVENNITLGSLTSTKTDIAYTWTTVRYRSGLPEHPQTNGQQQ